MRQAMPQIQIRKLNQITIPQDVRKILRVGEGDMFDYSIENGKWIISPLRIMNHSVARERIFNTLNRVYEKNKEVVDNTPDSYEEEIADFVKEHRRSIK